jgi:hypothetical protein
MSLRGTFTPDFDCGNERNARTEVSTEFIDADEGDASIERRFQMDVRVGMPDEFYCS